VRNLYIGRDIPFTEAKNLEFKRVWEYVDEVKADKKGSDLLPMSQVNSR